MAAGSRHHRVAIRALEDSLRVGRPKIRTATRKSVAGDGVAILTLQILTGGGHVDVESGITRGSVRETEVPALHGVTTTGLGVALETIEARRLMHCLHCFVHRNGHGVGVGNKGLADLLSSIGLLVANQAVDVFKFGFGRCRAGFGAEADVTITAYIPVSEDIDAIAVDTARNLSLHRRSRHHLGRFALPLIHDRSMNLDRFVLMAGEAGPGTGPGEPVVLLGDCFRC